MPADIDKFPFLVRIYWQKGDTISDWDKMCITAIENYGLPGYRYMTVPNMDAMDFYFKDDRDAMWFKLQCE